jgi:hypothetical protein
MNDWKTEGMKGMKATIREIHWELETCGWAFPFLIFALLFLSQKK